MQPPNTGYESKAPHHKVCSEGLSVQFFVLVIDYWHTNRPLCMLACWHPQILPPAITVAVTTATAAAATATKSATATAAAAAESATATTSRAGFLWLRFIHC